MAEMKEGTEERYQEARKRCNRRAAAVPLERDLEGNHVNDYDGRCCKECAKEAITEAREEGRQEAWSVMYEPADETKIRREAFQEAARALATYREELLDQPPEELGGVGDTGALTEGGRRILALADQPAPGPEPGDPIWEDDCPVCKAHLRVEHGDDPGEISVIYTSAPESENSA